MRDALLARVPSRVLGSLRDHPHDDTALRIARLLGLAPPNINEALAVLERDYLVAGAGEHWQLTRRGWQTARRLQPEFD